VSAHLTYTFDVTDFRTNVVGGQRLLETGTARGIRIALNEGAQYARTHHRHTKRTGRLTSTAELRAEVRRADSSGAWGYITNYTPYGAYVEYGTKAHDIWPKAGHGMIGPVRAGQSRRATGKGPHEHIVGRGIALRFRRGGLIVFARMVQHPGNQAMPFMYPAGVFAGSIFVRETENWTFVQIAKLWE
jgi:hypothetical protein